MANFYIQREGEAVVDMESTYGLIVTHVEGMHAPDVKPVFKREWATEDGVDIHFPTTRKKKSRDVIISCYVSGSDFMEKYEDFVSFVSEKKFDYWDTLRDKKASLIFDGSHEPLWISYTSNQLHFKITLLNYSGEITDVV